MLPEIVEDKLEILLVSETKVDPLFPSSQFTREGFGSPFRLDRDSSGGGIMYYSKYKQRSRFLFIEIRQLYLYRRF